MVEAWRSQCTQLFSTGGLRFANPPYALLLAFCLGSAHAAPESVSIPTANLSSAPAPLSAFVFQPTTPSPHPAVLMLHGCGGAYARDSQLNARHLMWGEYLAATVAKRGEPMQIVTYPETYHDFDNPGIRQKRVRRDVPNGVNPGQSTTVAPNPDAREDAKRRTLTFFDRHLKSAP